MLSQQLVLEDNCEMGTALLLLRFEVPWFSLSPSAAFFLHCEKG